MTTVILQPAPEKVVTKFVIIRESFWRSIVTDAITFMMVFSLVGIGIWLNSTPLQWIGGLMSMVTIMAQAVPNRKRMTIEEAKEYLASL
jgi:hypothetical protein